MKCSIQLVTKPAKKEKGVTLALKSMLIFSTLLMAILTYFLTLWALPESFSIGQLEVSNIQVYYSYLSGLLAGLVIGVLTKKIRSHSRCTSVRELSGSCPTLSATNITAGVALGFNSVWPIVLSSSGCHFYSFQI